MRKSSVLSGLFGLGAFCAALCGSRSASACVGPTCWGVTGFVSESSGLCMHPNGSGTNMSGCGLTDPPWSITGSGQIMVNGLCLDVSGSYAALAGCNGSPTQTWKFTSGQIVNQGTSECLYDTNADSTDYAGLGWCGTDYAPNLWMPLGFPMVFPLREDGNLCVDDLNANYNSDNDDTVLGWCSEFGQEEWQYNLFPVTDGVTGFAMSNLSDGYALDVYGAYVDPSGLGAVDMATPNGTPAQTWLFASESGTPAGSVLIESGINGGGTCLDLQYNDVSLLNPLDAYSCDSPWGPNGSNGAQLFTPYIVGFPH